MKNNKRNWEIKKLGDIAEIIMGQSPPGDSYNFTGIGIPLINGPVEFGIITPKKIKFTTKPTQVCKSGDILISIRATLGLLNISDEKYCLGRGVAAIRVLNNQIENEYLWYLLTTFVKNINQMAVGAIIRGINKNDLMDLEIPIPPIYLQQEIIRRLNAIRELQELNNLKISKTDELHDSLINEEIKSDKYSVVKISEITRLQEFTNPKKSPGDEFQYVDISAIDSENLVVDLNKIKHFKGKDAPSRARKKIEIGDLLFSTVRPNLKRIAKIDFPTFNSLASTGFTVLRPDINKINPDYMGTVICSGIITEQVLPQMKGAAYPAVSDSDVFNAKIPIPDRSKQDELAERFLTIERCKKSLIEQRRKLLELFESMLNKFIKEREIN